ncbi:hypothetical protein CR513_39114, partial [Mucuna pruriens]
MRIWRQIAPGSKTWSRKNRKFSKSTHKDSASWRRGGKCCLQFANLVVVGERIELGIKCGKFTQESGNMGFAKKLTAEKKKGEANTMLVELVFPQGKGAAPSYTA